MKNNKGFAPIVIVLIIIAVLALGGVAYYVGKSSNPAPQNAQQNNYQPQVDNNTAQNNMVVPTTDKTANWKTYSNSQYGFEFQYPAEFSGKLMASNFGVGLSFPVEEKSIDVADGKKIASFKSDFSIDVEKVTDIEKQLAFQFNTVEMYIKNLSNNNSWNNQVDGYFTYGGIKFLKYTWAHQVAGEHYIAIVGNNFIDISYRYDSMDSVDYNTLKSYSLFKQILSTFKFISADTTKDIKINGTTIKIPTNWQVQVPTISADCLRSIMCNSDAAGKGLDSYKIYNPSITTGVKINDINAIYVTLNDCANSALPCPVLSDPQYYPNLKSAYTHGLTIQTYGNNMEAVNVYNSIVSQLK